MAEKFIASPNYIHRNVADMDILIAVGANIADFNGYIEMNKSAVLLWEALKEPCQVEDLKNTLMKEYGITEEEAMADAAEFLKLLQTHNMVEVQ